MARPWLFLFCFGEMVCLSQMVLALILFAVMYALLLKFSEQRWIIALVAAAVFLVVGIGSALLRGVSPVVFILCAGVLGVAVRVWLSRGKEGQA